MTFGMFAFVGIGVGLSGESGAGSVAHVDQLRQRWRGFGKYIFVWERGLGDYWLSSCLWEHRFGLLKFLNILIKSVAVLIEP